jgi:hypothetical protein
MHNLVPEVDPGLLVSVAGVAAQDDAAPAASSRCRGGFVGCGDAPSRRAPVRRSLVVQR